MSAHKVMVIGKEFNPSTRSLIADLKQKNIPYTYWDLEFNPEYWDIIKLYKILSIPVLFIDQHFIVGYSEDAVNHFFKTHYFLESNHEKN